MVRFQLIRMSSYAKIKLQMCWVTQRQCRSRQMWKIFTNSLSTLTFYLLQKNDLSCTEQSIHGKFQLISMSSYAKNKQQMCRVTQHQCNVAKCGKYSQIHPVHWLFVYYKKNYLLWLNNLFMVMFQLKGCSLSAKNKLQISLSHWHQCRSLSFKCGKYSQIHPVHFTFCLLQKNCCWLNNLFMLSFQHTRMSSYAKNKQQMCWVTQHQCSSRQMWKIFTNSPRALTFVCFKKWLA